MLLLSFFDCKHTDPNYSCAYVTIRTAQGIEGHGLSFTIGRGTEIVVKAVKSLSYLVVGESAIDIYKDFAQFWRSLTSETQLRWVYCSNYSNLKKIRSDIVIFELQPQNPIFC